MSAAEGGATKMHNYRCGHAAVCWCTAIKCNLNWGAIIETISGKKFWPISWWIWIKLLVSGHSSSSSRLGRTWLMMPRQLWSSANCSAIEASYFCLFQTSSARDRTPSCRTCKRLPTLIRSRIIILFFPSKINILLRIKMREYLFIYSSIQSSPNVTDWFDNSRKEGSGWGCRGACSIDSRDGPNLRCFIGWALSLWAWMISLIILINFVFNLNVQCF